MCIEEEGVSLLVEPGKAFQDLEPERCTCHFAESQKRRSGCIHTIIVAIIVTIERLDRFANVKMARWLVQIKPET